MPLLEVEDLRTGYGAAPVLHGVTLSVDDGETAVLFGLNGAGKTTTLMTIAGLLPRWGGSVVYDGKLLSKEEPDRLVRLGLVLIPEGRHVFPGLSVEANLRLGAWTRRRDRAGTKRSLDRVMDVFPRLKERAAQLAGTLSGGEQQMLAIARGLMANPRMLLIDEASLGLSPKLAHDVFDTVRRINEEGVTVLMVEQNAGVLRIAHRAYIMEKGRVVHEDTGEGMLGQGELRRAYLGAPAGRWSHEGIGGELGVRRRAVSGPGEGSSTPAAAPSPRRRRISRERRITYTRILALVFWVAGFVVIGLGWNGMARVACPDCQLPYLLSGGATGIGLIIVGAAFLVIGQIRADRLRAETHLEQLVTSVVRPAAPALRAGAEAPEPNGQPVVVAGPGAYHRPDCRLLKGKSGLATLTLDDARTSGPAACRVCNPLEEDARPAEETEPAPSARTASRRRRGRAAT
ncbi:MAG: ABC transporter ATP-binding protein [Actinomycetota bacterium]